MRLDHLLSKECFSRLLEDIRSPDLEHTCWCTGEFVIGFCVVVGSPPSQMPAPIAIFSSVLRESSLLKADPYGLIEPRSLLENCRASTSI